jgi:hypothetical protein
VGSFGGSVSLLKTKIIFVNEFSKSSVTTTVMTVVECLNKMVAQNRLVHVSNHHAKNLQIRSNCLLPLSKALVYQWYCLGVLKS